MTMDIKTTKLNNTQATNVDSSTTRTPAKTTESGKSFADELSSIPNSKTENKVDDKNTKKTNLKKETEEVSQKKSTTDNLTTDEKKEILKDAGKKVSDNIVLMNNHSKKEREDIAPDVNLPIHQNNSHVNQKILENDEVKNKNNKIVDISNNFDKTEKVSKDVNVEAIANQPTTNEEMTVIKYEPITPIIDVSKSFNSSKTSDIVKFLDSNLTTNNTSKSSKADSSKTSETKSSEKTIKMTESDAKFFNNLIENNQQVIEGTKTADSSNSMLKDVEDAKSVQVSKTLLNALKESQENNKSFRVDFDKDLSVILRVNKDGKISAEFLPGDKAVEQYLKANIPQLQQQFKDEGLEYENLSYRQSKKGEDEKQKQQHRDNKKENGYE